jgi:hypothetical protein
MLRLIVKDEGNSPTRFGPRIAELHWRVLGDNGAFPGAIHDLSVWRFHAF